VSSEEELKTNLKRKATKSWTGEKVDDGGTGSVDCEKMGDKEKLETKREAFVGGFWRQKKNGGKTMSRTPNELNFKNRKERLRAVPEKPNKDGKLKAFIRHEKKKE